MPKILDLPFIYPCQGIPPRKRSARKFFATAVAPFSFPEADASELEPAILFKGKWEHDGKITTNDTLTMKCRGMLVRPLMCHLPTFDEAPYDEERLSSLPRQRLMQVPKALQADSAKYAYEYGGSTIEPAAGLNPAKITHNGFQDGLAELQDKINRNLVLVDGLLHVRVPMPSWNLHLWGSDWKIEPSLRPDRTFAFPGDQHNLALEFAAWCKDRFGMEVPIVGLSTIEALSTDIPDDGNPIIAAALALADRAELNILNVDYFGPETKRLGLALQQFPTVAGAIDFVAAFEEAATAPEAHPLGSSIDNATWFDLFWKLYELLPEGYKVDDGDEHLIAFDEADVTSSGLLMP